MGKAFKALGKKLKNLNWVLLLATVLLPTFGVMFVNSACSVRLSVSLQGLWISHLKFACLGFCLMLALACSNYRKWIQFATPLYFGTLLLLILVLIPHIGTEQMGARRWLFGVQPSEPAKLAVICMLAMILGRAKASMRGFKGLLGCLVIAGVPGLLILAEPDLGTAIVLGPTVLVMLFVANVSPRILGSCVLLAIVAVAYVLTMVYFAEAPSTPPERRDIMIKCTGLRPHQVRRIETFLYPMRDLHGSGYNVRQSEIAVGSGGISGKGYKHGQQNMLGYLPASVSANDFIFPVVAEETGFIGACILLALYLFGILVPGIFIAIRCLDDTGKLLVVGVVSLIFCHVFINIGMTVRIVPITGLPLPFFSQGGTFMLVAMAAMGVLQSVAVHGRTEDAVFRH